MRQQHYSGTHDATSHTTAEEVFPEQSILKLYKGVSQVVAMSWSLVGERE
jgi:hypothetical protein